MPQDMSDPLTKVVAERTFSSNQLIKAIKIRNANKQIPNTTADLADLLVREMKISRTLAMRIARII